jgi:hypothetical protein
MNRILFDESLNSLVHVGTSDMTAHQKDGPNIKVWI